MNNFQLLTQDIGDKTIVWFEGCNEYLVTEKRTAHILEQLQQGIGEEEIGQNLADSIEVPIDKAMDFVMELKHNVYIPKSQIKKTAIAKTNTYEKPKKWELVTHYKIGFCCIQVRFQEEHLASLVHPKYAHLETVGTENSTAIFEVFQMNNKVVLEVNEQPIGAWSKEEVHYFQGKFSMELIQQMHQKPEREWIGVFHASAVSNSEKSVLFLGDSGNGKSTSLALLQANGFTCLADDFVPMAAEDCNVYRLPSAISVKKNSWPILAPFYPQLANASEYHLKLSNKIIRYLPPNSTSNIEHLPCNNLVFIKYHKDSEIQFSELSKVEAFERLIPDSWISPVAGNVKKFLRWFSSVNCYQLTYSNNEKMIHQVHKIFSNEL